MAGCNYWGSAHLHEQSPSEPPPSQKQDGTFELTIIFGEMYGGDGGIRTRDPLVANEVLSH